MKTTYSPISRFYSNTPSNQFYKSNFSDFHLAHRIHAFIKEKLIPYDINHNGKFEEREIKRALIEILNENQEELQYVVQNVFRYDRDNDGAVTYQQFIKFCLEQHFGQMAIQRLHRRNAYQNSAKRVMNRKQFIYTLQYGFSNLTCEVKDSELELLFSEVDLDRDGFISYEDYFVFLREYFSNKKIDPANQDRQPVLNDDSYQRSLVRIGKLIFPQIRSLLIEQDYRKGMTLNADQIRAFIQKNFKFSVHASPLQDRNFTLPDFPTNRNEASYQQALKIIIESIFSPNLNNNNFANSYAFSASNKPLSNEQFVQNFFQNQLSAIRVRPARYMLDEIYEHLAAQAGNKSSGFTQKVYAKFLRDISNVFQPNNRALV